MTRANNSILKIGLIYTISNIVVKGIVFLTTPIFTRLMSQTAYGEFSSISSWANIITTIVTLNLYSSISVAKHDYDDVFDKYLSSILILGNIVTAICWVIIESNIIVFENIFSMDRMYIRSIMLYSFFSPATQILLNKYRMYNEYKKVVIITWTTLIVSTVGSLLFVCTFQDKLMGRVLGYYVILAVINIIFWIYILIEGKQIHLKYCKYALNLALPLVPHELAGIVLTSSDRIIIQQLCGAEKTALYSLAYTISTILNVFLSSINQAWVPWFYDKLEKEEFEHIRKASNMVIVLFAVGCIGVMLVGPEIIMIFGGKQYLAAKSIVPPVCLAVMFQLVYTMYVNIEFYMKKTSIISIATIMATIINVVLNYIFIPHLGYVVAAYTTAIGFAMMCILHILAVRKISDYSGVFSRKTIMLSVGVVILGMLIILLIYEMVIIRMVMILAYFVLIFALLYKYRKEITVLK